MDAWQRQHIQNKLPELLENTYCNETFLSFLKSKNLLTAEETQHIQNIKLKQRKATILYELLETRTDSYKILLQGLVKTKQSGAYLILNANSSIEINQIGNLEFKKEERLSRISGTGDLEFFKGKFGNRNIAIRREDYTASLTSDTRPIIEEVELLTRLDCQENILRYFTCKIDDDLTHLLLVFELCNSTLDEYIRDESNQLTEVTKKSILRQLTNGLQYLHSKNILYLNLRPTSILVYEDLPYLVRPKFSNFRSATKILANGQSRINSERLLKNTDWLPGNIQSQISQDPHEIDVEITDDVFSLGCLFHFVMYSDHPFGKQYFRNVNMITNIPYNHHECESFSEGLIKKMLARDNIIPLEQVISMLNRQRKIETS